MCPDWWVYGELPVSWSRCRQRQVRTRRARGIVKKGREKKEKVEGKETQERYMMDDKGGVTGILLEVVNKLITIQRLLSRGVLMGTYFMVQFYALARYSQVPNSF